MTIRRWFRELFRGRETRYGVRYLRGKYEKLDFVSRKSAEEWALAYLPALGDQRPGHWTDFVIFEYQPVELVIDRHRVRRSEHPTP